MARHPKPIATGIETPVVEVIKTSAVITPPPARQQFISLIGLPEVLPAVLAEAVTQGWQLLTIVADRRGNDHVAYLTRTL